MFHVPLLRARTHRKAKKALIEIFMTGDDLVADYKKFKLYYECSPPAWGGRLAGAEAMFLQRSQCGRTVNQKSIQLFSHSAAEPISQSTNQPLSRPAT